MNDIPNDKKPDLSEIFDLTRHKAVAGFTDRFENLYRQRDEITDDIHELSVEAKDNMFSPVEVRAMKDIARWRIDDKHNAAAAKLAALRRVSNAVKLDLFSWADAHIEPKGSA